MQLIRSQRLSGREDSATAGNTVPENPTDLVVQCLPVA